MKSLGDFKQEIIKLITVLMKKTVGDWTAKIDIMGDKIIILALNRRISVLKHVDEKDALLLD